MTTLDHHTIRKDAADTLRRLGWHQGNYIAKGPARTRSYRSVCMVEALGRAAGLPPAALGRSKCPAENMIVQWNAAQDLMIEIAAALGYDPGRGLNPRGFLTNWNDTKGRTFGEVLGALEGGGSA
ncbi:DUF6197 family protein [Nonomuraea endophytica]|uniref:DUF6197 family protein n=1 Tax=Nonomuraea endophytica TaxID=714136 RepID=UPI0037CA6AE0